MSGFNPLGGGLNGGLFNVLQTAQLVGAVGATVGGAAQATAYGAGSLGSIGNNTRTIHRNSETQANYSGSYQLSSREGYENAQDHYDDHKYNRKQQRKQVMEQRHQAENQQPNSPSNGQTSTTDQGPEANIAPSGNKQVNTILADEKANEGKQDALIQKRDQALAEGHDAKAARIQERIIKKRDQHAELSHAVVSQEKTNLFVTSMDAANKAAPGTPERENALGEARAALGAITIDGKVNLAHVTYATNDKGHDKRVMFKEEDRSKSPEDLMAATSVKLKEKYNIGQPVDTQEIATTMEKIHQQQEAEAQKVADAKTKAEAEAAAKATATTTPPAGAAGSAANPFKFTLTNPDETTVRYSALKTGEDLSHADTAVPPIAKNQVKDFQRANGLVDDGLWGKDTQAAFRDCIAKANLTADEVAQINFKVPNAATAKLVVSMEKEQNAKIAAATPAASPTAPAAGTDVATAAPAAAPTVVNVLNQEIKQTAESHDLIQRAGKMLNVEGTDTEIVTAVEKNFSTKPGVVQDGKLSKGELAILATEVDRIPGFNPVGNVHKLKVDLDAVLAQNGISKQSNGGYLVVDMSAPSGTPAGGKPVASNNRSPSP